ncbi:MAG TPA: hypothetical protein VHA75_17295 [Rugosimonospora sp.]|nr:hypothetical protein [Rugosimonospora sp.]
MVTPLSEQDARAALRLAGADASNPALYDAQRRDGGWFFGWRRQNGRPRIGTRSWVVADNGRARPLAFQERADDAIAAELAKGAGADG